MGQFVVGGFKGVFITFFTDFFNLPVAEDHQFDVKFRELICPTTLWPLGGVVCCKD